MTEMARYLSGTAGILLRNTLEKLQQQGEGSEHYTARLYQALMLAYDAGFPCGIRARGLNDGDASIWLVIKLPTGKVFFELDTLDDVNDLPTASEQLQHIQDFCSMPGNVPGIPTDPYNGHCPKCYAFKGQHGGECVERECGCHMKGAMWPEDQD